MLNNILTFHHRMMARYLRNRGWVVFFLEEEAKHCNKVCWLELYKGEENRRGALATQ